MKFKDYEYKRIDIEELKKKANKIIKEMEKTENQKDFLKSFDEFLDLRNYNDTMINLASIRHSIDTKNSYYNNENSHIDQIMPEYENLIVSFYKAILNSKFKNSIKEKYGAHFLNLAELTIKSFDEKIVSDLKEENKLISEYSKLLASADIDFKGSKRTLSELTPFMEHQDRDVRKAAWEAYSGFFEVNESEFDRIYDELVKLRHKMALKLGYKNYVQMAYDKLLRTEYGPKDVKMYRESIYENIVPLATSLRERQKRRLDLQNFKYYDENLEFLSGNASPKGDYDFILKNAQKMYNELSPETAEFFTFMLDKDLLDLKSKKGKQSGGYCTFIPKYKAPFIFSNFNGTSGDIDVLTHEAGHAFQVYESKSYKVPEYNFPTLEACEIHSMSMEFLTWPWMDLFFKEDAEKYKFSHLQSTILFLPYGVLVDEFQHFIYENPELSPKERKLQWREIERKYLPHRDYENNEFYENGGFFFKQIHIFTDPFYYIDYTLAQVLALQFFIKSREDRENTFNDYLDLCRMGGSKPFLELVKESNLKSPFNKETIALILPQVEEYLNSVDDFKF